MTKCPRFLLLMPALCFFFIKSFAGVTDPLFAIKNADERLKMVEYYFNGYKIDSREAAAFREEVIEKGNIAEKLVVNWMWEERSLPPGSVDSSIAIFDRYLPAVKQTQNPQLLAILYSVKANALLYSKRYSHAFENYLYAYDNLKKDPAGRYYNQSWLLYNIAMNFYLFKDYPKTIEMTFEVAKLPPPMAYSKTWFDCINYDLLGMAYLKSNRYDSAQYWLNKTYESAVSSKDTAWIGISQGNLGLVFYEQAKYDSASPHLETGVRFCTMSKTWDNVTPFAASLAHIYILKGKMAEARQLLDQAKEANEKYYKLSNQQLYFNVYALYEKKAGNFASAFALMDSVRSYERKASEEFELSKRALAESRVAFEKQSMENLLLQQKSESEKWQFYGLAVILVLVLAAAVLWILRQKLRYSLQQKVLENQKLEAEKELSTALFEIREFASSITEKNRAIDQLLSQVQQLKADHQEITIEEVEAIEEDMKLSTVLTEEGWNDFDQMYDKAYPGMLAKIRQKLPELDENDFRYLMLTQLGLSDSDIAGMFGEELSTINSLRAGIVSKLQLTDEDEIAILMESL